jgi:hypothetical protein
VWSLEIERIDVDDEDSNDDFEILMSNVTLRRDPANANY